MPNRSDPGTPAPGPRSPLPRLLLLAAAACQASTSRPPFVPRPDATHAEVQLSIDTATVKLAAELRANSVPILRVTPLDGFIETPWFDARTLQPTTKRPVGPDVVKVRAWVDPAKPSFSAYEVEGVYVPRVDPSRPSRELEVALPIDHPVAKRIAAVVKKLVADYGQPEEPPPGPIRPGVPGAVTPAAAPIRAPGDTVPPKPKPDTTAAPPKPKPDTAPAPPKRDTTPPRPKRDTTAHR